MRALAAVLCWLTSVALQAGEAPQDAVSTAEQVPTMAQTDWADCLACHEEQYAGLPQLTQLRPPLGSTQLEDSCLACHEPIELSGARADWRHPVRPVGSHLACTQCHPAVAHSAEQPPPLPSGDYNAAGCFTCHGAADLDLHAFRGHGNIPGLSCRGCHPPHSPLRVQLPASLIVSSVRENWGAAYDWYESNSGCVTCHPPATLLLDLKQGFVSLNTVNYHDLHVVRGRTLCIECHQPHGSNRQGMLRSTLLTGEEFSYFSRIDGGSCALTCHGVTHDSWNYTNRLF